MFILIWVAIVPVVILHSMVIASQYKKAIDFELKSGEDYANAISVAFTNFIDRMWYAELSIGLSILENSSHDPAKIKEYLINCADSEPTILGITWANPDGVAVYSNNSGVAGLDSPFWSFYEKIRNGEDKVMSNLFISEVSQNPTFLVARAIRENGVLKGIVTVAINVNELRGIFPPNRVSETSSFGLIDENGMIVYSDSVPDLAYSKRQIKEDGPAWKSLKGEVVKISDYKINDGTKRLMVSVPLSKLKWAAYASIDIDEVIKNPYNEAVSSVVIMIFIILCSFLMALYLIVHILKPVRILEKAANAISRRDYTVRTNFKRKDELGQTGLAFDHMTEHIQELESGRQLFLQTAAHELRNPMTSIKGIASLISRRISEGKPIKDTAELITTLENEVNRLSKLLNMILEAFKLQRDNIEIKANMSPLDINDVVQTVIKPFIMDTSNNRNFILNASQPAIVFGDFDRLADVIRNFIDNAIKYSKDFSEIIINIVIERDDAIISVKDQGMGIPEDQLDKIFSSFYRVKNGSEKDPGGMGLGLYICKDIIIRHGGSIWAENNLDKGSIFYIKLPLYKE
ncbi:sensor histidine kinase YycG [Oxobacter pfennigii]|uniref:histidine kinase n=2 Tax=Oxobacter pfennigii TaxID=36849 RepID=A0A0N8NSL2_9CLOT|nr:sensor histidine kinase YycG [Oxobacter pfennigii]